MLMHHWRKQILKYQAVQTGCYFVMIGGFIAMAGAFEYMDQYKEMSPALIPAIVVTGIAIALARLFAGKEAIAKERYEERRRQIKNALRTGMSESA